MFVNHTIKRLREQRHLTQAELAKRVNIHRVSLARLESGTRVPSLAVLARLAQALDVNIADLLEPTKRRRATGKGR